MRNLHEELDTYLTQRRALGFQLKTGEYLLSQFLDWLQSRGKRETFTIEDAVQWAREPADAAPVWWSQRLTAVRPFAAWLAARGADVPRIPLGLLPTRTTRRAPFIYSQADLNHTWPRAPCSSPTSGWRRRCQPSSACSPLPGCASEKRCG